MWFFSLARGDRWPSILTQYSNRLQFEVHQKKKKKQVTKLSLKPLKTKSSTIRMQEDYIHMYTHLWVWEMRRDLAGGCKGRNCGRRECRCRRRRSWEGEPAKSAVPTSNQTPRTTSEEPSLLSFFFALSPFFFLAFVVLGVWSVFYCSAIETSPDRKRRRRSIASFPIRNPMISPTVD